MYVPATGCSTPVSPSVSTTAPIAGLKFATSASGDAYFSNNHVFRPSYLNSNNLSSVEASRSMVAMIQWENILSYRFNLRDRHNFDLMAGMTTTYDLMENIKGKAAGGPTNKIYEIGDGWPQARNVEGRDEYLQRVTTDRQEQIMLSYLGRVAYNFDKRYMLEASLRYDGSSVFGRDVRWAAFPLSRCCMGLLQGAVHEGLLVPQLR